MKYLFLLSLFLGTSLASELRSSNNPGFLTPGGRGYLRDYQLPSERYNRQLIERYYLNDQLQEAVESSGRVQVENPCKCTIDEDGNKTYQNEEWNKFYKLLVDTELSLEQLDQLEAYYKEKLRSSPTVEYTLFMVDLILKVEDKRDSLMK